MNLNEPIGFPSAPKETLEALGSDLEKANSNTIVTLVTDSQGHRGSARYAVLLDLGGMWVLSREAFGPRYGAVGAWALSELVTVLLDKGVHLWREAVIMPSHFTRLMNDPSSRVLLAAANQSDPELYRLH